MTGDKLNGAVYLIVCIVMGLTVWAVAKWVSIPAALGVATYILKPNFSERKP